MFRLGSVTKQFTSLAIMMLVEQGKVGLQDPIDKYLPGYPMQGKVITVEHLLTHTSGIQSYTDIPGYMASKVQADLTVQQLIDAFKNEPMQFDPGTRYRYNNSGYVLLGAIIEKASGQTYAAYIADHIFKPLGMTHSYYGTDEPKVAKLAGGYSEGDKPARPLSMTQPYAAGSLLSTVDDLAVWDGALYTEKLVKRASLEKIWTPVQALRRHDQRLRLRLADGDAARAPDDGARRRDLRVLHLRPSHARRSRLRGGAVQHRQPGGPALVPGEAARRDRPGQPVLGTEGRHGRPEGASGVRRGVRRGEGRRGAP